MMNHVVENGQETTSAGLIAGIVEDAKELAVQQLKLFQVETRNELHQAKEAAVPFFIGMACSLVGAILLGLMAAQLLERWLLLPSWAGLGIVGGTALLAGLFLALWGNRQLNQVWPLSIVNENEKEDKQPWKMKP